MLVTLSTLLRGSIYEKLRWTFKLYDINGDGCITRAELGEIVLAIHELMGRRSHHPLTDRKAREQLDYVFRKLDINQDGVITLEEFIESCLKVNFYYSNKNTERPESIIYKAVLIFIITVFALSNICRSTNRIFESANIGAPPPPISISSRAPSSLIRNVVPPTRTQSKRQQTLL
ncbi:hypothetical protein AAG570_003095 [Ranatra chinensis]|uniref:EF-hand domain-containing protein n=1 Tax=Ranatra chinensis TaxID=642074 RepID=A0ABD0YSI7_9HEMI